MTGPSARAVAMATTIIAPSEGFRSAPYLDTAGVWTIGFGSTFLADGSRVTRYTPSITLAQAVALRDSKVHALGASMSKIIDVPLRDCEWGGLLSFGYNIGIGAFHGSSTRTLLNAGRHRDAADHMLLWDKTTDPETHELVECEPLHKRRVAERAMFLSGAA